MTKKIIFLANSVSELRKCREMPNVAYACKYICNGRLRIMVTAHTYFTDDETKTILGKRNNLAQ